jgi:hypothetical protein
MSTSQLYVAIHADAETIRSLKEGSHGEVFEREFSMQPIPLLGWVGPVEQRRVGDLRKYVRQFAKRGMRLNLLYLEAGAGEAFRNGPEMDGRKAA